MANHYEIMDTIDNESQSESEEMLTQENQKEQASEERKQNKTWECDAKMTVRNRGVFNLGPPKSQGSIAQQMLSEIVEGILTPPTEYHSTLLNSALQMSTDVKWNVESTLTGL